MDLPQSDGDCQYVRRVVPSWTSRNPGARAVLPDRGHRSIVPSFRRLREQTRANALTTRTIRFPLGGDIPDLTADARNALGHETSLSTGGWQGADHEQARDAVLGWIAQLVAQSGAAA